MYGRTARVLAGAVLLAGCTGALEPQDGAPSPSATPADSTAATDEASLEDALRAVEDRVALYDGIATGVIALVRVGDDADVVVRGRADVARGLRMAPDQTWPVASLTKMMTATVILQLVEEGRLALTDPARRWLPEIRDVSPPITIEHLLSHQSGLTDSGDAEIRRFGFATSKLVRAAARQSLDFEPGTDGSYSNVGFGALGLVIERLLDQPLGRVLAERVFRPAGMAQSTLFGRPDVHGYGGGRDWNDRLSLRLLPAAGSVVSTAEDVDAFLQALWQARLTGAEMVNAMRTPQGPVGLWSDYGLGLGRETFTCGPAWGHGGRLNGFSSEAWTLEGGDRTAVVVVNDDLSEVVHSITDAALCGG